MNFRTTAGGKHSLLRTFALSAAALAVGAGEVRAQKEPFDRLISEPGAIIVAPEFSPDGREMSHCTDGLVRIMALDESGGLVDPSGSSDVVLGPCDTLTNGPEWGYIESGPILAWTVPDTGAGYQQLGFASRSWGAADWTEVNPVRGTEGLRSPYPVKDRLLARPWALVSTGQTLFAGMIYDFGNGARLETQGLYPTWKPGSLQVVDVDKASGRLVMINVASGASRVISGASSSGRFNPWVWTAPETSNDVAMVFNFRAGCIEFFYTLGDNALPDRQLCATDIVEGGVIETPEPFIFRGRSYISFRLLSPQADAIYVAGAVDFPGEAPYLARTSSDEQRVRRDPEPAVNGRRASIYYTSGTGGGTGGFGVYQTEVVPRPWVPRPEAE